MLRSGLTEGLILSVLGTAGGFLMAYWCRHLLVRLLHEGRTMYLPGAIDGRVMALCAGISLPVNAHCRSNSGFSNAQAGYSRCLDESSDVVGARGRARMHSGLVTVQ